MYFHDAISTFTDGVKKWSGPFTTANYWRHHVSERWSLTASKSHWRRQKWSCSREKWRRQRPTWKPLLIWVAIWARSEFQFWIFAFHLENFVFIWVTFVSLIRESRLLLAFACREVAEIRDVHVWGLYWGWGLKCFEDSQICEAHSLVVGVGEAPWAQVFLDHTWGHPSPAKETVVCVNFCGKDDQNNKLWICPESPCTVQRVTNNRFLGWKLNTQYEFRNHALMCNDWCSLGPFEDGHEHNVYEKYPLTSNDPEPVLGLGPCLQQWHW